MARVNPPKQLRRPEVSDPNLAKYLDDLNYIIFQLWRRTGAGSDLIEDGKFDGLFSRSTQDLTIDEIQGLLPFEKQVEQQPYYELPNVKEEESLITLNDAGATLTGDHYVVVNNTIVVIVQLTPDPDEGQECVIKRYGTATVTIDGNGKSIDDLATKQLLNQYDSVRVKYFSGVSQWMIIG